MSTAICKVMKAGHSAQKLLSYIGKKSVGMTANMGFGMINLPVSRVPWATKALIAFHGNSRACQARHVVFSLPKGFAKNEAVSLLRSIADDWIKTYAPERNWALGIHSNTGIFHAHLAVANVGTNSRPLKFRPHNVVAMSEMRFTEHANPAKGKGKRGLPIYTKARQKLAVQDLARLLVLPSGDINEVAWVNLEKEGSITNLRLRKGGSPVSFEYQGRRIRFTTLRRFILDQRNPNPNEPPMPLQIIKPNQPLPTFIASKLSTVGFTSEAIQKMSTSLSAAHNHCKESHDKPPAVKQHSTPNR